MTPLGDGMVVIASNVQLLERETGIELLEAFGSSPSAWECDGGREAALVFAL
jgi:hypothetical protein